MNQFKPTRGMPTAQIMRNGSFSPTLMEDGRGGFGRGWATSAAGATFDLSLLLREEVEGVYFRTEMGRVFCISGAEAVPSSRRGYEMLRMSRSRSQWEPKVALGQAAEEAEITVGKRASVPLSVSMLVTSPVTEIAVVTTTLHIEGTPKYNQIILDFLRQDRSNSLC